MRAQQVDIGFNPVAPFQFEFVGGIGLSGHPGPEMKKEGCEIATRCGKTETPSAGVG